MTKKWRKLAALATSLTCVAGFLALTLPGILQPKHYLKNLEPYPDGLLYTLSARNLATKNTLGLIYQDSQIEFWVSPLYAYFLSVVFFITDTPEAFFVMNIFLGVSTLGTLLYIMWQTTRSIPALLATGSGYLLHAYVLWLPTVPMAENLSLFLFVVALAVLVLPRKASWKVFFLFSAATLGIVLTKYASVFVGAALAGLFLVRYRKQLSRRSFLFMSAAAGISYLIFVSVVANPLSLVSEFLRALFFGTNSFYSVQFILPNITAYMRALTFGEGRFLWLSTPLSSIFAALFFLVSLIWHRTTHTPQGRWRALLLSTLFLSQFPLMLIFYVADARYMIYSIPLLAISLGWLTSEVSKSKYSVYFAASFLILLVGHVGTQLPLFRETVSANLFGNTTGWQYEAIQHFDQNLPKTNRQIFVITALPPFLVDAYSQGNYRVLPVSAHQEFLAKGEWVWGSDVSLKNGYSDLSELFTHLLTEEHEVYISNAYVTHLQEVTTDYEKLKEQFSFVQVSEGCLKTCNIYKLSL